MHVTLSVSDAWNFPSVAAIISDCFFTTSLVGGHFNRQIAHPLFGPKGNVNFDGFILCILVTGPSVSNTICNSVKKSQNITGRL